MKRLAALFWELFRISLFVIGGGYAIIAVADDAFARRGWTEEGELVDRLPVFQMVPGLVATHTAVYVGNKVAGGLGALVGVVAVAVPSVAIFTLVSAGYASLPLDSPWLVSAFAGLRSALTGIIAATVLRSARKLLNPFAAALFALSLAALTAGGAPVWAVLLASMLVGVSAEFVPSGGGRRFQTPAWLGTLLFLKYGALCFGGGFVLVPMYIEDFVGAAAPYLQLPAEEFSNLMALTQMTPGPIGVNGATFFGYRLAGAAGAVAASAALLLPGSLLAFLAFRSLDRFRSSRVVKGLLGGVRPASVALMCVALWAFAGMCVFGADGRVDCLALALVALSAVAAYRKAVNIVLLIVLCAAASSLRALWQVAAAA
jgi:chromate transporter